MARLIRRPFAVERGALLLLFVAAAALSLTRVDPTDTPWHLATARLVFEGGQWWPTTNTFSYTHPDFPLYQQYPVYQSLLYATYSLGGFEALSVLHALLWFTIFALCMRWAGGFRAAAVTHTVWLLVLLGLQQRMVLRPDVLTIPLFLCLLLLLDTLREEGKPRPLTFVLIVLLQWVMANTHQLFTLGLAAQGLVLLDAAAARILPQRAPFLSKRSVGVLPLLGLLSASVLVCLLTPIGIAVLQVPFVTADSLASHRSHVQEFAPLHAKPYNLALVLAAVLLAAAGMLRRRRIVLYDAGLVVLGAVLAALAMRGTALAVALGGAVFVRTMQTELSGTRPARLGVMRTLLLSLTFSGAFFIIWHRWVVPTRGLVGVQVGVGRSVGQWPDAAMHFVRAHPPPGKLLSLSWYLGNFVVWELYPEHPVFVDPRFEAYPRPFLLKSIAAESDDRLLAELLAESKATWMLAELRLPSVQERAAALLSSGEWQLVFVDPIVAVLVHDTPETKPYLAQHGRAPAEIELSGLSIHDDLRALQLQRLAHFMTRLGAEPRAAMLEKEAARILGGEAVGDE